ncbi:protein kinase [Victivallis vadensis]|uniref:Protein kinase n=1 Tax=Victivallis vadensis TaxID=172901 RepID=A0A848AQR2_9BACT|nr:protein kinase [Victivallis vadensis]NMD85635.1 protein kinase [Victivallis vadensis]
MSSEKERLTDTDEIDAAVVPADDAQGLDDTDEIGASAVLAGDAQHNSPRMQPVETLTDSDEIDATVILANGAHNDDVSTQPAAGEAQAVPELPGGTGQYRFLCNFAAGGVGQVGKARDLIFDRIVAVKKLNEKLRDNPRAVSAFFDECRLNARLDHPSIVPVYAMGKDESGHLEVMMKLVNGSSFAQFIRAARQTYDHKKISNRQERHALTSRLEYFLKVCEAVSYCHSRGIMHGDIKPANIMMGEFGEVYLMDWGSAQPLNIVLEHLSGTPNYLPPEFLRDRRTSTQVDVFALGMVLFEVVTLRRSGNGAVPDTAAASKSAQPSGPRNDVNDSDSYRHYLPELKIGKAIKAIIYKAIHPDPAQRYQSVSALASDVRHFIYDEEVSASPDGPVRKLFRIVYRNRIRTLLVLGALFAFLGGWLFYSYYRASEQERIHTRALTQQLRFQSYTDRQAAAVEKKFLLAQTQLLLFSDNLIEEMARPHEADAAFYDNEQYKSPETSPPGMQDSEYYPNPVNLRHMVRIPAERPEAVRLDLLGPRQFTQLCNKVIRYTLDSNKVSLLDRQFHAKLFDQNNLIQRLFIAWADGTRYSYPGTYQQTVFNDSIHSAWWKQLEHSADKQEISWSKPYRNNAGRILINCSYPLYSPRKEFLGFAGIELRVSKLFASVLQARRDDPVHEFYYVGRFHHVISFDTDGLSLTGRNGTLPDGVSVQPLVGFAERLRENHYRQFEAEFNGKRYHVDGALIPTSGGVLLQLIENKAFHSHRHPEE